MSARLVKAADKHGGIETFQRKNIVYFARRGEIVAGANDHTL
jgi:hypothetical protein